VKSVLEQLKDNSDALAIMPTLETMTNTINKMRQRKGGRRPDPSELKTLVLSEEDKLDLIRNNFLIYDKFQKKSYKTKKQRI
jgi:hypothetical protein